MAGEPLPPSGEKVLRAFGPSRLNYWGWYLAGALMIVTVLLSPFGLLAIAWAELGRYSTRYSVTDKRIVREDGILGKRTRSTIYQRVTDIDSRQSFMQRLLGIGDIYVNTAGGEGPEIIMRGIGDMPGVKSQIQDAWAGTKSG